MSDSPVSFLLDIILLPITLPFALVMYFAGQDASNTPNRSAPCGGGSGNSQITFF